MVSGNSYQINKGVLRIAKDAVQGSGHNRNGICDLQAGYYHRSASCGLQYNAGKR